MKLIFGTRGSRLAVIQTESVINSLAGMDITGSARIIETSGCKRQGVDRQVEDKKQWIYELELALENKEIDFAVHSAKDVPYEIQDSTQIHSVLLRENCSDVFIPNGDCKSIEELPAGSKIGTSSLRRKSQILNANPKLEVVPLRGNINTRIEKLKTLDLSGAILARAGLNRMDLDLGIDLDLNKFVPAANQGILCIQFLKSRSDLLEIVRKISDSNTQIEFLTERKIVFELGADCHSSLGVYAKCDINNQITISCSILSVDGSRLLNHTVTGDSRDWEVLTTLVTNYLLENGAKELLCG